MTAVAARTRADAVRNRERVVAGLPTDSGYTNAFLVSAFVALAAAITAFLIPSRRGRLASEPVAVHA